VGRLRRGSGEGRGKRGGKEGGTDSIWEAQGKS